MVDSEELIQVEGSLSVRVQRGFADILRILQGLARDRGIEIIWTSGYRSRAEQAQLYAAFRAGTILYPVARPGRSYHNFGLAVDFKTSPPGRERDVGRIAEAIGLRWGGRFGDPIHIDTGSLFKRTLPVGH